MGAELGLITLRLQRQELEEVFLDLLFQLSEIEFVCFYTFNLLDNLLQLVLNQGGNSDVDPGLRDGAASFKMVNFEVRHLKKTLNMI